MIDQYVTDHFPTAIAQRSLAYYASRRWVSRRGLCVEPVPNLASSPMALSSRSKGNRALHGARRRVVAMPLLAKLKISSSPHSLHRLPVVKVNHRTEWKHLMT
jgi:hypothetical protein